MRSSFIVCAVLALSGVPIAGVPFASMAAAEDGDQTTAVSIRLVIAEVPSPESTASKAPEELVETIRRLAADGKLSVFHDLELNSVDEQLVRFQTGGQVATPSGRMVAGRFGSGSGTSGRQISFTYDRQNVGTMISVTPRVVTGGTVLAVQIEKSRITPPPASAAPTADAGAGDAGGDTASDAAIRSGTATSVFDGTVLVPAGKTVLVGSMREAADGEQRRIVILASASSERLATAESGAATSAASPSADALSSRSGARGLIDQLKVFHLKNARATDVTVTLTQLLGTELRGREVRFAVDDRTNSILVSADGELTRTIADVIEILDVPVSKSRDASPVPQYVSPPTVPSAEP